MGTGPGMATRMRLIHGVGYFETVPKSPVPDKMAVGLKTAQATEETPMACVV
jgi:hypothetical protein